MYVAGGRQLYGHQSNVILFPTRLDGSREFEEDGGRSNKWKRAGNPLNPQQRYKLRSVALNVSQKHCGHV